MRKSASSFRVLRRAMSLSTKKLGKECFLNEFIDSRNRGNGDPRLRLADIVDACTRIASYIEGFDG